MAFKIIKKILMGCSQHEVSVSFRWVSLNLIILKVDVIVFWF